MATIDIEIDCDSAQIIPAGNRKITVSLSDASIDDMLNTLSLQDMIGHFTEAEILDAIGEKTCIDHFGIETK